MELALSFFDSYPVEIIHRNNYVPIKTFKSVLSADQDSLVFIASSTLHQDNLIRETKAITILCDFIPKDIDAYDSKCLLVTSNPKLIFAKIVNQALSQDIRWGVHPTAVIHPEARVHPNTQVGPYVYIGKSEVGEGSIIHPNVSIYDNVKIGQSVIIDSGSVIGAAGFGFVRDEQNIPVPFPQLGGVIIGDYVEIGANVCIDRGALQDTIISKHTKIDNFSQISHNVVIGENNYIIGSNISGSVVIGNNCWIAPSRIMNKIKIEDNVTVGYGANVLHNLHTEMTYMGNPCMKIDEYSKLQYKLKKLIKK